MNDFSNKELDILDRLPALNKWSGCTSFPCHLSSGSGGSLLSFSQLIEEPLCFCPFLRNLYEHMQCGCSLVSFWHSEMWAEIWLLDVRRLAAGPPDGRRWHLRLHAQRRMGPNRWVGKKFALHSLLFRHEQPNQFLTYFQEFLESGMRSSMTAVRSPTRMWHLLLQ